jgi:hypothetical protein
MTLGKNFTYIISDVMFRDVKNFIFLTNEFWISYQVALEAFYIILPSVTLITTFSW